jgi:hypothetical protein
MVFNACISVKNIGKPCAGEPHARFDGGGLKRPHPVFHSSRVRQTDLKDAGIAVSSLLYPFSPRTETNRNPATIRELFALVLLQANNKFLK